MTNETASRANGEVMDIEEMRLEAHIAASLIDATMAVCAGRDHDRLFALLEMAHERVEQLESALNDFDPKEARQ